MNRNLLVVLPMAVGLLAACSDDPTTPPPPVPAPEFQPLTTREAVVNNIEVAWNQRRADKIDELLDENFVFYFVPGDVGGEIPPSWDRAVELETTEGLLTSNMDPTPAGPVCQQVRVDLANDELTWVEIPPTQTAFGEIWYSTTLFYRFTFEMEGDLTFIAPPGAKAEFVVRPIEGGWRLVEWRDTAGDYVSTHGSSEEAPTWGKVKALYR